MLLKPRKAFKNGCTVWGKASTLLSLLHQCRYTHVLVHAGVRELQKQRWPSQPSWPCTTPTSRVMDRWQAASCCSRGHQQQLPGFSLPGCRSPAVEQHRKGRAVAISWFLFTAHRSRAPAIDYHVFRVICKGKFPPPSFVLWFFSPTCPVAACQAAPSSSACCMLQSWFTRATQLANT